MRIWKRRAKEATAGDDELVERLAKELVDRETRTRLVREQGEVEGNKSADLLRLLDDPSMTWEELQEKAKEIRRRS